MSFNPLPLEILENLFPDLSRAVEFGDPCIAPYI